MLLPSQVFFASFLLLYMKYMKYNMRSQHFCCKLQVPIENCIRNLCAREFLLRTGIFMYMNIYSNHLGGLKNYNRLCEFRVFRPWVLLCGLHPTIINCRLAAILLNFTIKFKAVAEKIAKNLLWVNFFRRTLYTSHHEAYAWQKTTP